MVKFHESTTQHTYSFPTVTLAYFLRYPNPHATHVISTDVLSRHFDPSTNSLYTSRLHLKTSKMPPAILKLLPRSWLNVGPDGKTSQSYILERSVVDMRDGVMVTETKNLDFVGVLEVVERQVYRRPDVDLRGWWKKWVPMSGYGLVVPSAAFSISSRTPGGANEEKENITDVHTKIELLSTFGERRRRRIAAKTKHSVESSLSSSETDSEEEDEAPPRQGFFASLGRGSIQRSIEAIGMRRTERAVPNAEKGMNAVLERFRKGGLIAVLEGRRKDGELAFAGGSGGSGPRALPEDESSSIY